MDNEMEGNSRATNAHEHTWQPASELGMGRYRCRCGAVGFRSRLTRYEIRAYKGRPPERFGAWRPREHNGHLEPLPTLDDYDCVPRR